MDVVAWDEGAGFLSLDRTLPRELEESLDELSLLALRVAMGVLRHRENAEDVAQDAMLTMCRKWRTLRKKDRLRPWLVRVAFRLALDRRRSEGRRERRELRAIASLPPRTPEDIASSNERRELVWRAIDGLPDKHRLVLVLSAIEGHDTAAVARLLNVRVGTVKSRLHTARAKLMETLRWIASESDER